MKNDFSQQFEQILELAFTETRRFNSPVILSEHLVLGSLRDKENCICKILNKLNVDIDRMVALIEERLSGQGGDAESTTLFEKQYKIALTAIRHLQLATAEARKMGNRVIGPEHIIIALMHDSRSMDSSFLGSVKKEFLNFDITIEGAGGMNSITIENKFENDEEEDDDDVKPGFGSSERKGSRGKQQGGAPQSDTPALDKFGYDMTAAARMKRLDPVVGRDREIERLAQILSRRKKNNPVLIGEPGVGKSAIVEGLALRIVQRNVPHILLDKRVIGLDMAGMVAGTKYRGQFEERIKAVLDELSKNRDIILFIDEIHTIVGAGGAPGSMDAANMLKPALARGEIQCIGATTLDEYRQNIEKDGALERRFQRVMVEPTSADETMEILRNVKEKYEEHHNVRYTDDALAACVALTGRYISDRNFPDKALDALDEAGSRVHITTASQPDGIKELEKELAEAEQAKLAAVKAQNFELAAGMRDKEYKARARLDEAIAKWKESLDSEPQEVDEDKVAEVVAMMTGVPTQRVAQAEGSRLLEMGPSLKGSVVGQDEAIKQVVKAIQRNRIGLKDPNKPIGTFMFLGPTGVGKTHLAKKLAEYLFDSTDALIRLDMSEFMEKFTVSRLVGAPPGYVGYEEGGQLTEKVRRHPYSVVLLDEIEKAHPDVFNILLQVMDEGRLTDSLGRKIDFKNTILIMTSNVGSRQLKDFGAGVGFNTDVITKEHAHGVISKALNKVFSPEFLNRVDDVIMFDQLDLEAINSIIDIELRGFFSRVSQLGLTLDLRPEARRFLANKGYDRNFGARPLKRAIQKYLEDELAEIMLRHNLIGGALGTVTVDYKEGDEKLTLEYLPAESAVEPDVSAGDTAPSAPGESVPDTD